MKRRWTMALGALLLTGAAPTEREVAVDLHNFGYAPGDITMVHGAPYRLVLTNRGHGGHDFTAPAFFAAALIDQGDVAKVARGGVAVPGGTTVTVHLIAPPAGTYQFHCSHFLHASFGMKGTITVR